MTGWSRRDVLRVSAGAAAAAPVAALGGSATVAAGDDEAMSAELAAPLDGPVMCCVHDAGRGEISILHGEHETVVRDRALVARIMRAARRAH